MSSFFRRRPRLSLFTTWSDTTLLVESAELIDSRPYRSLYKLLRQFTSKIILATCGVFAAGSCYSSSELAWELNRPSGVLLSFSSGFTTPQSSFYSVVRYSSFDGFCTIFGSIFLEMAYGTTTADEKLSSWLRLRSRPFALSSICSVSSKSFLRVEDLVLLFFPLLGLVDNFLA